MDGSLNWIVIAGGTVLNMVLGFLWYGPIFGSLWLKLIEKKPEEIKGGDNPLTYVLPMLGAFASTLILAVFIAAMGVSVWWQGLLWGLALWGAIGGSAILTTGVFEERKLGMSLLFISYQVLAHGITGAVLAVW